MKSEAYIGIIAAISVIGLVFAWLLARWVLAKDTGTDAMRKISNAIQSGAEAFMGRMNKTIAMLAVVVAVAVFFLYLKFRPLSGEEGVTQMQLALWTTGSFALGALCSGIAGYAGMWIAIRSNIRTASAARSSLNTALQIALRGGAVSGLLVVVMSLLGVVGLYYGVHLLNPQLAVTKIPIIIAGYGFGASFVALFAQLGGGIYTKAADVGADLVGKVEAGIPEDDPRNPAVIADLVGDNVGDCAGRGADLFESSAAENIGSMILGAALAIKAGSTAETPIFALGAIGVMLFPLVARAFGIIASIVGVYMVSMREDGDPMSALNRGFYIASVLAMGGFYAACRMLLYQPAAPTAHWWFFSCGVVGMATALLFVYITQYYTEYKYRPVKSIAEASQTGPATNVIAGIAVGLESTFAPVIVIGSATLLSYWLGEKAITGGGLFGTAVATMGMLATAAYILAMDTFGPITDNAGGIIEMSHQPEEIRQRTDRLDAVGNTTKALTKGYAIGSAALAAFLLFSAYIEEVNIFGKSTGFSLNGVNLAKPAVFVAALLGAMLVFLFSALTIRAVGKAAYGVINAVRKQFKDHPGIMKGTEDPDYHECVDLVTQSSLKEMVLPGLLVTSAPLIVGIIFKQIPDPANPGHNLGAEAVAAMLMVATIAGILMALFLNNGGGAWDNAKKYIETGRYGGKRSDAHKAAVVGDTVGDPFKDTAGPSLHVLIKLLATITLVLAPFFI